MKDRFLILLIICFAFISNCREDPEENEWIISSYTGSYKNIKFSESLVKEFAPGIYMEKDIPEDINVLDYGRIEIDFRYDGGALNSFMPLLYYGSINDNDDDNAVEESAFHLVVEIGHYNVIPLPVEYLFYTISTFHQPRYCRDSYCPILAGVNYTLIIDKRPEGLILQLKEGQNLTNVFPHAFFPDSSLMFFKDVSSYIERNNGDSLKKVLMVGKGFTGFENGLHEFNGMISGIRIYKYIFSDTQTGYELEGVRNQHTENQQVMYAPKDNNYGTDKYIIMKYEFWPYKYESGELIPDGEMQSGVTERKGNKQVFTSNLKYSNIGFYKIYLQTVSEEGDILNSSPEPFKIWVYPKEWDFEFYEN